jgi:hypothetical protein
VYCRRHDVLRVSLRTLIRKLHDAHDDLPWELPTPSLVLTTSERFWEQGKDDSDATKSSSTTTSNSSSTTTTYITTSTTSMVLGLTKRLAGGILSSLITGGGNDDEYDDADVTHWQQSDDDALLILLLLLLILLFSGNSDFLSQPLVHVDLTQQCLQAVQAHIVTESSSSSSSSSSPPIIILWKSQWPAYCRNVLQDTFPMEGLTPSYPTGCLYYTNYAPLYVFIEPII